VESAYKAEILAYSEFVSLKSAEDNLFKDQIQNQMKSLAISLEKRYKYQYKMKLRVHNFEMNTVI
jgi:hypothetical protein